MAEFAFKFLSKKNKLKVCILNYFNFCKVYKQLKINR